MANRACAEIARRAIRNPKIRLVSPETMPIASTSLASLHEVRHASIVIRFAHPSGRTALNALLRYAPFLQWKTAEILALQLPRLFRLLPGGFQGVLVQRIERLGLVLLHLPEAAFEFGGGLAQGLFRVKFQVRDRFTRVNSTSPNSSSIAARSPLASASSSSASS